jgi:PGF-CTERM protein
VFRSLNEHDRVAAEDFYDAVSESGGPAVADRTREFVETDAVPTVWSAEDHATAFDAAPAIRSVSVESFRVDGPAWNRTAATPTTLVTGERLAATAVVENDGGRTGEFVIPMTVDGERVAARQVTLDPGERATETLATVFDRPGSYQVGVGGTARLVEVREPAEPTVTDVRVDPASPTAGDPVRLIATVSNDADRPAEGSIAFRVDGDRAALRSVALDSGYAATVTANATLPSGEVRVSAGDTARTVDVARASEVDTPGFGVGAALAALVGSLSLSRRRG